MKMIGPYQGEAKHPSTRKQRLEALLAAWRFPRFEYWATPGVPPAAMILAGDELALWLEILRVGEPMPPRTHIDGLKAHARLRDLRVEDLGDDDVLIAGDRVAVRSAALGVAPHWHDWSLLVPAHIDGTPTEALLHKRFHEVQDFGDALLVFGSLFNCTDSIPVLVREALTATAPGALLRAWKLSLALNLEYRFLPALPAGPAKALAALLGEALLAAADRLDVETDMRLMEFSSGHDPAAGKVLVPSLQLPASRLARLLEIDHFFDRDHHSPGSSYYDAVASAFARIAEVFVLGNTLLALQPGSALITALESVCLERPDFIATYASHTSFHAYGAFALLQLPQQMAFGHQSHQLDMKEEWLQSQELGRELLVLGDASKDCPSLITLGIWDESQAIDRRHHGVPLIQRGSAEYDGAALWAEAVSDADRGALYVEALEKHFRAPHQHSDAAIVFALRLLAPLRASGQPALATRLAAAIAEAYVVLLQVDAGAKSIPGVLGSYGKLLADLRASLDPSGETWQTFLRPFDAAKYLELARADASRSTNTTNDPGFTVPRILRAHAEALVALASESTEFAEPLAAALDLYDADRQAALNVGAFSWSALARLTGHQGTTLGDSLFVRIGRLFGRDPGDRQRLDAFLCTEPPAHILADVAVGLGARHRFAEVIRPKLATQVEALLSDGRRIALGHALELANVLQVAELPQQAELLARRTLEIIEKRLPQGHDPYSPVAHAILAGALAQQKRWQEVLALETEGQAIILSPHARSIENMRALAFLETGKPAEAEQLLRRVLDVDPANHVALVNLTAVHVRAAEWSRVIEVAEHAKTLLHGDDRDEILLNEAHAREKLGDLFGARKQLGDLTGPARLRPDVIAAREELDRGRAASPPPPAEIAAGGALDAPPLAALLDAVETSQTSDDKGRSLEALMVRLFGGIAGFEVIEHMRTETEEIDLTILNGSSDHRFVRETAILLVECKNWLSRCGKNEFVIFKEKIENRSERCSLGFLVSWNGFAQTVTKEMLRGSREKTLVVPLTGDQVRQAVKDDQFWKTLTDAWLKAIQT